MSELTKDAFEETIKKLLTASPKNSSKGDPMKEWFFDSFNVKARVARITEDKQLGNRITEQFTYKDAIVVFVLEAGVNRDSLVRKVCARQYAELTAVLIVGANGETPPFSYEHLLTRREDAVTDWISENLEVKAVQICDSGSGFTVHNDVWQLITYGAPGTGKSFRTKKETEGHDVYRTTFHPDSDYSTFVGAYKPTMSEDAGRIEVYKGSGSSKVLDVTHEVKKGISYDFVPQAFIKAYVDAWQKMSAPGGDETTGPIADSVFLVIEEINRGNCAQIFGDLFQLLDRGDDGYSDYPIDTDSDLKRYLARKDVLGDLCLPNLVKCGVEAGLAEEIISGKKLVLPSNLYIRATMNTSDQSLFPIDSAFKRRWEWKYVPIAKPTEAGWKDRVIVADGKTYDWWEFLRIANKQILDTTKSEDKQLGYFFVKAPDATGHIKADRFAGKVLFYLYNDVFKDYTLPAALFGDGAGGSIKYEFKMFFDEHGEPLEKVISAFLDQLKVPNMSLPGTTATTPGTASAE